MRGGGRRASAFHATIRRRGWTDPSGGAPLSVVLMSGGCLYVPDADYRDFLTLYASAAEDGEALYVVERPSRQIRFYADFDVHLPVGEDPVAFTSRLAAAFAASAAAHLQSTSPTVSLRVAPKALDGKMQKVGVHLVMPRTRVSVPEAEALRKRVLADLEGSEGLGTPANGWEDAFDASVYRGGGLRLVESRKMVPCGCPAATCTHGPSRKVDAGRPYLLHAVFDATGHFDEKWSRHLAANAVMRILMSSIRLPCGDAEEGVERTAKRPRGPREGRSGGSSGSGSSGMPRLAALLQQVHPAHADLVVLDVSPRNGSAPRLLRVDGDGSRYCPNVQRSHTTSSIYFVVGTDGVALRCHCKKGSCPSFRGRPVPLTQRGALFLGTASERGLPPGFV